MSDDEMREAVVSRMRTFELSSYDGATDRPFADCVLDLAAYLAGTGDAQAWGKRRGIVGYEQ